MKKINSKKIISAFAVLAVSAGIVCAVPFAGCGKDSATVNPAESDGAKYTTIQTAVGTVQSRATGRTIWVSPDADPYTQSGAGTFDNPYHINHILESDDGVTDKLQPGDTVLFKPGLYKNGLTRSIHVRPSGTYDSYIEMRPATHADNDAITDGKVILDFSAMTFDGSNRGIQLYGDYLYWHDIDVCGAGDNGLFISGDYNVVEHCEFYNNRDTGLQLGREASALTSIDQWPSFNLVKNCTSHNNYDNVTYGENADGFAAKLTVGYGNVFDGCIAYRNSDDGWDLYAYSSNGNIGTVIMYNCVAYENGFLEYTQIDCNKMFKDWDGTFAEVKRDDDANDADAVYGRSAYDTKNGDGNGFKLGGSVMEGDVVLYNCLSFHNRMHGVTDNSNPGFIKITGVTSYDNSANINNATGKIVEGSGNASHANIDLARQTYSYNSVNKSLSVKNLSKGLKSDAYRGSVTDSYFLEYQVNGKAQLNTNVNDSTITGSGTKRNPSAATEIFEQLPIAKNGENNYTYNINGAHDLGTISYTASSTGYDYTIALNPDRVHITYRNAIDHSINMHDILKIKNQDKLLGSATPIGAELDKTNWDGYTHLYETLKADNGTDAAKAVLARAKESLTVNCEETAVYQPFDVPVKMLGCTLTWSVNEEGKDYMYVGEDVDTVLSEAQYRTVYLNRPASSSVDVILTATIEYNGSTVEKQFNLTVMPGTISVGDLRVETQDGEIIKNGGVIADQYIIYKEPEVYVQNGLYPNHVVDLDKKLYDLESTYMYKADSDAEEIEVKGFTPSNAGVYTITHTATLKADSSKTNSMTYKIFVASPSAKVAFTDTAEIKLTHTGFTISGEPSSAIGSIYAVASKTALTFASPADILKQEGVQNYPFRATNVVAEFANNNNSAFNIYYVLANGNGDITSTEVYSASINYVEIGSLDELWKLFKGGDDFANVDLNKTIYALTADYDLSGKKAVDSGSFKAFINGMGHTLKNFSGTTSMVKKVEGGTLMNVKLENIQITGGSSQVGIFGEVFGANLYNIQMINCGFAGGERVGSLVGHAKNGRLNIEQVYVDGKTTVASTGKRAGGIVGIMQADKSSTDNINVFFKNCMVSATVSAMGESCGGMIGEFDPNGSQVEVIDLSLENCVFNGVAWSKLDTANKVAGMVGNQKGNCSMSLSGCLNVGVTKYGTKGEGMLLPESIKNASPLIGGWTATVVANFNNNVGLMDEYNFPLIVYEADDIVKYGESLFESMNFDLSKWTLKYASGTSGNLAAPYLTLNYLAV